MRRPVPRRIRLARFILAFVKTLAGLALAALVVFYLHTRYDLFDREFAGLLAFAKAADARLSNEAFAGISLGSLVLVLVVCLFPLFIRRFDGRAYIRGLWRGLISALVFFVSTALYAAAEKVGRFYLIGSIAIVVVAGALLVEVIALVSHEEQERAVRTDIVASIASGLLFSVLLKLGEFALAWLRSGLLGMGK